jgi:hypothetical protein
MQLQKEKTKPKKIWIEVTCEDYNRLEPGVF